MPPRQSRQASWQQLATDDSFFDFLDVQKDGFVTRMEWAMAFDKLDSDKNGTVSKQEWKDRGGNERVLDALLSESQQKDRMTRTDWLAIFDSLDLNEDERLSKEEFNATAILEKHQAQDDAEAAKDGASGIGKADIRELRALFTSEIEKMRSERTALQSTIRSEWLSLVSGMREQRTGRFRRCDLITMN